MKKVIFFGSPDFAIPSLKALFEMKGVEVVAVFTPPDKPAGRGKLVKKTPVKIFSEKHNIKVIQPIKIRKEWKSCLDELKEFGEIHVGVVAAYGHILTKEILDFPLMSCLNVHPSILPRWRGATPIHRPILNGEKETGVTLMKMDEGLDTGDIVCIEKIQITEKETFGSMHDKLAELGGQMLRENLFDFLANKFTLLPQDDSKSCYADKISKIDAQIDWSKTALQIDRQIRAFNPYPGAYTMLNGKRLKVLNSEPKDMILSPKKNATITLVDNDTLEVQCLDSILSINSVQIEGKRMMKVGEFLRGHNVSPGEVLGE